MKCILCVHEYFQLNYTSIWSEGFVMISKSSRNSPGVFVLDSTRNPRKSDRVIPMPAMCFALLAMALRYFFDDPPFLPLLCEGVSFSRIAIDSNAASILSPKNTTFIPLQCYVLCLRVFRRNAQTPAVFLGHRFNLVR